LATFYQKRRKEVINKPTKLLLSKKEPKKHSGITATTRRTRHEEVHGHGSDQGEDGRDGQDGQGDRDDDRHPRRTGSDGRLKLCTANPSAMKGSLYALLRQGIHPLSGSLKSQTESQSQDQGHKLKRAHPPQQEETCIALHKATCTPAPSIPPSRK